MPIKNIVTNQKVTAQKLQRAKELRREMTPAEKILWEELRGSKLGVRFRRQQVIQGFIVDFYCHRAVSASQLRGRPGDNSFAVSKGEIKDDNFTYEETAAVSNGTL